MAEHIVLRIRSDDGLTIFQHQMILNEYSRVLFAKIGKPLSSSLYVRLCDQIKSGANTFLFIALYEGRNIPFTFLRSRIISIRISPDEESIKLIPPYLRNKVSGIRTWFEIDSFQKVEKSEVKYIHTFSSGKEISSSLRGTTSMFRVRVDGDRKLKTSAFIPKIKTRSNHIGDDMEIDEYQVDDTQYINNLFT